MKLSFTARIIADNKVTVPIEVRDRAGLKKDDLLEVTVEKVEEKDSK